MTAPHDNAWTDLCAVDDLPAEGGQYIEHGTRALAVFRINDRVTVMDDHCPHAGQSLSAGHVDSSFIDPPNNCVVCPWHGWAFRTDTGECPDNPSYQVRVYESRVVAGRVTARLNDK